MRMAVKKWKKINVKNKTNNNNNNISVFFLKNSTDHCFTSKHESILGAMLPRSQQWLCLTLILCARCLWSRSRSSSRAEANLRSLLYSSMFSIVLARTKRSRRSEATKWEITDVIKARVCLFVCWRLIAPPTAQGHLGAFTEHAHYTNIKHTNIIQKLVPSVLLS